MLEIGIRDNRQLVVTLNPQHLNYGRAFIVVRGLLSAREFDDNVFGISYDDFLVLKKNLDAIGLTDDRTVTDDAWRWIAYLQSRDEWLDGLKRGSENDKILRVIEPRLKSFPYEDQVSAISFLYNMRRAGLFDEMGVGKSLESLGAVVALMESVKRTLIVCPNTVRMGFEGEIRKHTHLRPICVPSGRKLALKFIKDQEKGPWDVMLIHPENLVSGDKVSIQGDILRLLKAMPWDLIIVDEFHQYKNLSAKRTKCVLSLLSEAKDREGKKPRAILMTGTPISESPLNAYVALKILNFDKVPHIAKFENHFTIKQEVDYKSRGKHMKIVGYKHLDELKAMLERVSIRRTKADMRGFPDRIFQTRDVFLSGKQEALYRHICGELVAELPRGSKVNLQNFLSNNTKTLRLRQIMNAPELLGEEGSSAKYEELDTVLDEILTDPEAKVVVWTEFRAAVDLLYDRYNSEYGAVKIYGGVTDAELRTIRDRFENDPEPRVAVCIPAKAGTGVDFLARARTAIYVDRPYSYTLYKQSLDRIHRRVVANSTNRLDVIRAKPASILFLDVVESVDWLIRDKLVAKADVADALTIENEKLLELGREDLLLYLK